MGRYSEFEDLRISGVRLADLRGYSYGREDVTAKTIANAYAQALSTVFTQQLKPFEVEILVGQVGESPEDSELYHILFDGSLTDEKGYVAMGGKSEELTAQLKDRYREDLTVEDAVRMGAAALGAVEQNQVEAANLEVAVLDRTRGRRKFRRLTDQELAGMLAAV